MFAKFVVTFCAAVLAANHLVQAATISGCTIQMTQDIPKTEPVYLQPSGKGLKLWIPEGDITLLKPKSELILACPGKANTIAGTKQSVLKLQCDNGKEFLNEAGKKVTLDQLSCSKVPDADIVETEELCSQDRGHIFNIGFNIEDSDFQTLFKVCYDNIGQNSYYAAHTVYSSIKYSIKQSDRKAFRANGMGLTTTKVNNLYTKNSQKAIFEKIIGKDQDYINNNSFLARGHLAPDADFLFMSSQMATYFYANVAPEFQAVNAGNWVRIETFVRNLATKLNSDLAIHTGHIGTLELADSTGKLVPIYLDDKQDFAAPETIYKVIKHEASDSAVVLVTSNNPFASEIELICRDVCEEANVKINNRDQFNKGYSYCCELSEFLEVVQDLPKNLTAKNLLVVPE